MRQSYIALKGFLILTTLLLVGCKEKEVEVIEITKAIMFYQDQPNESVVLSSGQVQFVQGWLNADRTHWVPHQPLATLMPMWCMQLTTNNEQTVGLCRYSKTVVLRGLGAEIEKPFLAQDDALFLRNIKLKKKESSN